MYQFIFKVFCGVFNVIKVSITLKVVYEYAIFQCLLVIKRAYHRDVLEKTHERAKKHIVYIYRNDNTKTRQLRLFHLALPSCL